MNATDPLQTKQQIAAWAGVSTRTVQEWAAGGCPHVRIGAIVRFHGPDVLEWLQKRPETLPSPRSLRVAR